MKIQEKISGRFLCKKVPLKAFTLPELLVVLAIIGILVLLAIPNQTSVISKAKATEAKLQLEHLHALQKNHFYIHSKYSDNLEEIGFEQADLVTEGGAANYFIEIKESDKGKFIARATSVVDFDQDGAFNVWEIDERKNLRETVKD